jgi:hypothetical protein
MAPTPSPTSGVGTRVLNKCLVALGAEYEVSGHPESGCPFFVCDLSLESTTGPTTRTTDPYQPTDPDKSCPGHH